MEITATEIRTIVYVLRCYRDGGGQLFPTVAALSKRMDSAVLHGEASPWRQPQTFNRRDSEDVEWIGSKLAARLLGWTVRRVQRHAADLDGRMVGGRLVYPAHRVTEYRDHLQDRSE